MSLDIAANPSVATLLHYQKDLIIERINLIFGERWITAVRFVCAAANEEPAANAENTTIALTGEEKNILSDMLKAVEDPDIKEKLDSLGHEIVKHGKKTKTGRI